MTDTPKIGEGEYVLTTAITKMFADSFAYAKARYGADYDRTRPYKDGGPHRSSSGMAGER